MKIGIVGKSRYIDADALLNHLPDDLPYKASVKRVLIQAPTADARKEGYDQGVRDFAERVKTYYRHTSSRPLPATVEYYIDQLAKEMMEGEE